MLVQVVDDVWEKPVENYERALNMHVSIRLHELEDQV